MTEAMRERIELVAVEQVVKPLGQMYFKKRSG